MRRDLGWLATLGCFLALPAGPAWANPAGGPPTAAAVSADALAASLRGLMLQFIPSPLHEDHSHWDQKKECEEIKFRGKGLKIKAEKVKVLKNHGLWQRIRITTPMIN